MLLTPDLYFSKFLGTRVADIEKIKNFIRFNRAATNFDTVSEFSQYFKPGELEKYKKSDQFTGEPVPFQPDINVSKDIKLNFTNTILSRLHRIIKEDDLSHNGPFNEREPQMILDVAKGLYDPHWCYQVDMTEFDMRSLITSIEEGKHNNPICAIN